MKLIKGLEMYALPGNHNNIRLAGRQNLFGLHRIILPLVFNNLIWIYFQSQPIFILTK